MPKILDRLVGQLQAKGMPADQANAVARDQLTKHGILHPGTDRLTFYGSTRDAMTPEQRAKDRAANTGRKLHEAKDYVYDPKTNRATLRKD